MSDLPLPLACPPSLDLQTHLAALEAQGLLVCIDRPINRDMELHPLVRCQFLGGIPEDQRRAFLWVTLTGEVDWHFQREAAEQDMRRLSGVVGVSNQTVIKPTVNTVNVRYNIMTALHRSWFAPTTIVVTADGGKVRLTGTVQSPHDREVAVAAAWAASGTTDVESLLAVIGPGRRPNVVAVVWIEAEILT